MQSYLQFSDVWSLRGRVDVLVRQGNKAAACKIYDDAVAAAADKGSSSESTYAFLVVTYAHFLVQNFKDVDAARSLYATALQQAPGSLSLWEGAIHLEENHDAPVRSFSAFLFEC